jgi:hypothetical protein
VLIQQTSCNFSNTCLYHTNISGKWTGVIHHVGDEGCPFIVGFWRFGSEKFFSLSASYFRERNAFSCAFLVSSFKVHTKFSRKRAKNLTTLFFHTIHCAKGRLTWEVLLNTRGSWNSLLLAFKHQRQAALIVLCFLQPAAPNSIATVRNNALYGLLKAMPWKYVEA